MGKYIMTGTCFIFVINRPPIKAESPVLLRRRSQAYLQRRMTDKEHSITALRPAWLDDDWRASKTIFAAGFLFIYLFFIFFCGPQKQFRRAEKT